MTVVCIWFSSWSHLSIYSFNNQQSSTSLSRLSRLSQLFQPKPISRRTYDLIMVHVSTPVIVAAVAFNMAPTFAAPVSMEEHETRELDELWTRGQGASRVVQKVVTHGAKDILHSKGTDALTDAINDRIPKGEPSGTAKGLAGASKHLDNALKSPIAAGTAPGLTKPAAGKKDGKKKRSFDDEELWTRGQTVSKIAQHGAKDILHTKATDAVTDAINDRIPKGEPSGTTKGLAGASKHLNDALKSPIAGAAAPGFKKPAAGKKDSKKDGKKKRSLDDELELLTREPTEPEGDQQVQAPPHAAAAKTHRKKKSRHGGAKGVEKRDLEELYGRFLEELEERDIDDEELWTRGQTVSKIAQHGAKDILHTKATDAVTDAINDRIPKGEPSSTVKGVAEAGKHLNNALKSPIAGAAAPGFKKPAAGKKDGKKDGKKKRSLDDELELLTREPTEPEGDQQVQAPPHAAGAKTHRKKKSRHGGAKGVEKRDLEELYTRFLEELEERDIDDLDA